MRAGKPRAGHATLLLALALAGCNSSPAPLAQPLDAGGAPGINAPQLAQNGDRERGLHGPAGAQPPAPPPAPPPAANTNNAAGRIADTPGEPMAADPMQDAGGFDPTPQDDPDGAGGAGVPATHPDGPHN